MGTMTRKARRRRPVLVASPHRSEGFPFGRRGGGRRMHAVRCTSPPSTPPSGERTTARKLRGKRKNERSRGTAAGCAVAATVDRFLRLPVWEACVERAADGRAQESARPKGLARS